jgi:hypothetical protein
MQRPEAAERSCQVQFILHSFKRFSSAFFATLRQTLFLDYATLNQRNQSYIQLQVTTCNHSL